MDRTFQRRVTIGTGCGIVILLAATFFLFWSKSICFGLAFLVMTVIAIERVLHSEYVLHAGTLIIRRGRFSREKVIALGDIHACQPVTTAFGLSRYLLLSYGKGKLIAVEPQNEASFVKCLSSFKAQAGDSVSPSVPSGHGPHPGPDAHGASAEGGAHAPTSHAAGRAKAGLLVLLLALPLALFAQTAVTDEDFLEDRDTLVADSAWADTMAVAANDTLPWPQNVQAAFRRLLGGDMFQTSQVGMMVYDLDADSAIFRHNERQLMRPASTMKVITAITALDRLGGSYQFKTDLCYTGRVDSCTLRGDVYCVGGFDPRFGHDDLHAFTEALRRMGVDTIRGTLYADKSMKDADLLGEGWCWDDDNPVLSPLVYQRKDQFMDKFTTELGRSGIYLIGYTGEKRKPQDAHCIVSRFHTIDQVLHRMLKESDNLYAESMFYQIAASTGNRPATAKSARFVERKLVEKLGLDPARYKFADGSGLSLYNYVSPELLVRMLRYAYANQNIYNHLYPALPIAGRDGTLRKRMTGQFTRGNVHAKTGTVTGVSSLCGYLTAANGHHIAFAIINQGVMHGKNGRNFQAQVCNILCRPQ